MSMQRGYDDLPPDLPEPIDDGAAAHLPGRRVPSLPLRATDGQQVDLAALRGRTVVYAYPKTGVPGVPMPDGWDAIPGARGCTPQALAFKDHAEEIAEFGARVFGLSTQTTEYQRELVERLHLPFAILSDEALSLTRALQLPTFEVEGETLLKRLTLIVNEGAVEHAFYPVFPSDKAAETVLAWLRDDPSKG